MAESLALNCDCMDYMRSLPDKAFDLAVVDPPYGSGSGSQDVHVERERESCAAGAPITSPAAVPASEGCLTATISVVGRGRRSMRYLTHTGGIFSNDALHWDIAPPKEYKEVPTHNDVIDMAAEIIRANGVEVVD